MLDLLAQAQPWENIWNAPSGSSKLWMQLAIGAVLSIGLFLGLMNLPTRGRRPVVVGITFVCGLFYVLLYLWPKPINRNPLDIPANGVESIGFWLSDTLPVVSDFAQIITAFLLGLGVASLIKIHSNRVAKNHPDKFFSALLLVCMATMAFFAFVDWKMREFSGPSGSRLEDAANWTFIQKGSDLLFDGIYQQMEAAMFSIIAFFILSAAYRAFRIRSIEATILLAAALIMMLSLMSGVDYLWGNVIDKMAGPNNPNAFVNNFRLGEVSQWIKNNLQTPSLRAMDFGIGVGALAMGLRLWLSLERGGISA